MRSLPKHIQSNKKNDTTVMKPELQKVYDRLPKGTARYGGVTLLKNSEMFYIVGHNTRFGVSYDNTTTLKFKVLFKLAQWSQSFQTEDEIVSFLTDFINTMNHKDFDEVLKVSLEASHKENEELEKKNEELSKKIAETKRLDYIEQASSVASELLADVRALKAELSPQQGGVPTDLKDVMSKYEALELESTST